MASSATTTNLSDLTLVSCWYSLKNKFNEATYGRWMSNLLLNVRCFHLIIFTDASGSEIINRFINDGNRVFITVVIKELSDLEGYKLKDYWIENHSRNTLLKDKISWELNMLWSEKIRFVKSAYDMGLIKTQWSGWCDIGYFRGRGNDIPVEQIKEWPSLKVINSLEQNKIYYAFVSHPSILSRLYHFSSRRNKMGLPEIPIPENQVSIAGGFFILTVDTIQWWYDTYYRLLDLYLMNRYLVKDDQIIVIDCILQYLSHFKLISETERGKYDEWFVFQRYLF